MVGYVHKGVNMGVIYVLTNPSFPEYVKIGYADDLEKRLNQLNKSECIPFAFRVYCVYNVEDRLSDLQVHKLIDKINPDLRSIDDFDGKKRVREFYNMSAEDAYDILSSIAAISGTKDKLQLMTPEGHEVIDEAIANEIADKSDIVYSEDDHLALSSKNVCDLYFKLKTQIMDLPGVTCEAKKLYMAFKTTSNVCAVIFKRNKLKVIINMPKGSLKDPKRIAIDMSNTGHWATGDYQVEVDNEEMIPDLMNLIKQSYDNK